MCVFLHSADYLKSESDINVHETMVPEKCGEHMHDWIEIGFVLSGKGMHVINQQAFPIQEGEMFLLNAQVPHEFISADGQPLTVRNCLFHPSAIGEPAMEKESFVQQLYGSIFAQPAGQDGNNGYLRLTGSYLHDIAVVFDDIKKEYQQQTVGFTHIVRSDLSRMLVQMVRQYNLENQQVDSRTVQKQQVVNQSIAYMKDHYAESISCEMLSSQSYLSTSYFNRIFREVTGSTVIKMLQKVRMEAACDLLENTEDTINEVAANVGYSDMKCFYKIFHKQNGCTPKEYRDRVASLQLAVQ